MKRYPYLIRQDGFVKGTMYTESTLLHFACRGDHKSLCFDLIKLGADPYKVNPVGDTPLKYCSTAFAEELITFHNRFGHESSSGKFR